MKNKIIAIAIIVAVIIAAAALIFAKNAGGKNPAPDNASSGITLYYRIGCTHCEKVEKFLEDNKVSEKIKYERKEAGANRANADELIGRAKKCGFNTATLGVPFLYDGANCLMGDEDIIKFFQNKLGQ